MGFEERGGRAPLFLFERDHMPGTASSRQRFPVLAAFALSGAAALAFEVIWSRSLSLTLGSTIHAVSTMLATFMLGLAGGGLAGGRRADSTTNAARDLGFCELGIAATGLLGMPLLSLLPKLYLAVWRAFHLQPTAFYLFQIVLCAVVMIVPTFLMGMTFPLASRCLADDLGTVGRRIGAAYSANTAGAVAGSLLAGFVLIPVLGLSRAALAAAFLNVTAAVLLLLVARAGSVTGGVLVFVVLVVGGWVWAGPRERTLVSAYSTFRYSPGTSYREIVRQEKAELIVLSEEDYAEGPVRALVERGGNLLLQVGGKIEGTASEDVDNTLLLARLPVASCGRVDSILVVGLGAGVTLAAAKPLAARVDVVEIHPGVIEAVRKYGRPGLLDGVGVYRDDARNHLLLHETRYDVITSEPSYPTNSAVGNLFTKEFFELAASRLTAGGVYCQWIPYYLLTNDDVTMVIRTFVSVFPHARLWKVPRSLDLLLVGGGAPFVSSPERIQEKLEAMAEGERPPAVLLSRGEAELRAIAADESVPINSDDRPILEFRAARNLRVGDLSILERTKDE
jgi:spermidine synthase